MANLSKHSFAINFKIKIYGSIAGSFAFPGVEGIDAEFPEKAKKVGPFVLNEGFVSAVMLSLLLTGYLAEKKLKE